MFKVKFFTGTVLLLLEEEVNSWLKENKDITIVHSNLVVNSLPSLNFYFYITYTSKEPDVKELQEIAMAANMDISIEATDINPEVLKPTS